MSMSSIFDRFIEFFLKKNYDINKGGNMNLKKLRKSLGMTQQNMAEYLNIARSTYNGYELNLFEPDITTLKRLADLYNVSIDYLCDHETKGALELGQLNEMQKDYILTSLRLNVIYFAQAYGFVKGLQQKQQNGN